MPFIFLIHHKTFKNEKGAGFIRGQRRLTVPGLTVCIYNAAFTCPSFPPDPGSQGTVPGALSTEEWPESLPICFLLPSVLTAARPSPSVRLLRAN